MKIYYPAKVITDFAGKLCIKEVVEFRANFPLLAGSKNVRKQLVLRVMKRLQFVYPCLASAHLRGLDG